MSQQQRARRDPWEFERALELVEDRVDDHTTDLRKLTRAHALLSDRTREGFQHVNLRLDSVDKRLDELLEVVQSTRTKASGAHRLALEAEERASRAESAALDWAAKMATATNLDDAERAALRAELFRSLRGHVPTLVRVGVGLVVALVVTAVVWLESCRPGG